MRKRELINDPFYKLIEKYDRCIIDYCLIEDDTSYQGSRSHTDVVLFAMQKMIERYNGRQLTDETDPCAEYPEEPFQWDPDIEKAQAHQIDPAELLYVPKILRTERSGRNAYDCVLPDPLNGEQIPYWYAFLEPPHTSGYGPDDFRMVNSVLFPEGTDELEVYEWTTDWSGYFDDGHEWWGTACWSVYDKCMKRHIVIMASATD